MADFGKFRSLYGSIRPGAPLGSVAGAKALWEGKRRTKYSKTFITLETHQEILKAVGRYAEQLSLPGNEWLNPKHMVTWLFQECWTEFDQEDRREEMDEDEKRKRATLEFNRGFRKWCNANPRMPGEPKHTVEEYKAWLENRQMKVQQMNLRVVGDSQ